MAADRVMEQPQQQPGLDAHLICVRTSKARSEGWLIDGVSVSARLSPEPEPQDDRPQ